MINKAITRNIIAEQIRDIFFIIGINESSDRILKIEIIQNGLNSSIFTRISFGAICIRSRYFLFIQEFQYNLFF